MASGTISTPQYTKTTAIEVTVTLLDADQIALSNDGVTFGAFQSVANNGKVTHALTSGDGLKTVSAKFRMHPDGAESSVVTAQTTLDTVAPTGALLINKGAPVTASASVTLSVTAADATTPVLVRFKNEAGDYGPFETVTPEKSWSLTLGVGTKTVTMQIEDAAGNTTTVTASIWLAASGAAKWLILKTPDYDETAEGVQTSYFREGAANSSEENDLLGSHGGTPSADAAQSTANGVTKTFDGWFEYTDGVRTEVTRGARVEITGGSESTYVVEDQNITVGGKRVDNIGSEYRLNIGSGTLITSNADPVFWMQFKKGAEAAGASGWRQTVMTHTSTDTYSFGDVESFFGGYKFDGTFGISSSMFVGGKIDLAASVNTAVSLGYNLSYTKSVNLAAVDGKDLKTVGKHDLKARTSVRLRVQGPHPLGDPQWSRVFKSLGALGVGSSLAIISATAGAVKGNTVKTDDGTVSPGAAAGLGLAAIAFGVGLVASVLLALKEQANGAVPLEPPTQMKLSMNGAELSQHSAAGVRQAALHVGNTGGVPGGAPGQIWMANAAQSGLELSPQGRFTASAPNQVLLATTDGTASLTLIPNTIRMQAQQLNLNGQQVSMNNVLQVLGPPPVIGPPPALPPPPGMAPGEVIMDDDL